uniref:G-protein coupled receptors family 1 profile domain-containing protein n=1 Tax=Strongyloides venezuelensis TaxID=75913 RepID=A0A0K0EUL2_STRVS
MILLGLLDGKIFSSTNLGSEKYCLVAFFTLRVGNLGFNSTFYILVGERIIASIKYKTYEKEKNAILCMGILLTQLSLIFAAVFVSVDRGSESLTHQLLIPCLAIDIDGYVIVILAYTFFGLNIISSFAYIILIIVNRKLYKQSSSNSLSSFLSIKYQVLENLQFLKSLLPCIITYLIATIITSIIVFYFMSLAQKKNRSKEDIFFGLEILQLTDIVYSVSFIIIPLITNYNLNKLMRFSRNKKNKILPSKFTAHININGKSNKLNENEIYFEQFKNQWNS